MRNLCELEKALREAYKIDAVDGDTAYERGVEAGKKEAEKALSMTVRRRSHDVFGRAYNRETMRLPPSARCPRDKEEKP